VAAGDPLSWYSRQVVAVVVLVDPQPFQRLAAFAVIQAMEGWAPVSENVWLVSTDQAVADVRDALRTTVPTGKFLVARLSGGWSTWKLRSVANWLRSSTGWF
jgi:hypothetical protein